MNNPGDAARDDLRVALIAATAAAIEFRRLEGADRQIHIKSTEADLVSNVDIALHQLITETILKYRPDDGILSEESSESTGSSRFRWTIDPLDGTRNFIYGVPHYCVSIACEYKTKTGAWRTMVAVVQDLARGEVFTAERDRGAWLDGRPLKIGPPRDINSLRLLTEYSYSRHGRIRQARQLNVVIPVAGDVLSTGSSALDLCWVAAARVDGFWEDELGRWDWLAASLILEESGGVVSSFGSGVIAGSASVHDFLRRLLS